MSMKARRTTVDIGDSRSSWYRGAEMAVAVDGWPSGPDVSVSSTSRESRRPLSRRRPSRRVDDLRAAAVEQQTHRASRPVPILRDGHGDRNKPGTGAPVAVAVRRSHLRRRPDHLSCVCRPETGGGRNHRHVDVPRGVPELGHDVTRSPNLVDVPIERVDDDESDRRVGVAGRPNQVGHVLERHRGIEDPQRQRNGLINRPRHGLPVTLTQSTVAKANPLDARLRPEVPERRRRRRVAGDEEHRTGVAGHMHRCAEHKRRLADRGRPANDDERARRQLAEHVIDVPVARSIS